MNKLLYIFLYSILMFGFSACTNDFEELNTNPNEPESVSADFLLPTVEFDLANSMVTNTQDFGDLLMQYHARYEFNDIDIYNWTASSRYWSWYSILQDVSDIIQYGQDNNNPNFEAIGLILKSFAFSHITDAYGPVPYDEALEAKTGNTTPAYDSQESIYQDMLADLERANSIIGSGSVNGDHMYGGDMSKWKKFANSLRVRLLMRTSNVQNVSAALTAIVNDPVTYPLFENNGDNAIYDYTGALPSISPISSGVGRAYEYYLAIPTTTFINTLKKYDDPRIDEWLDPNGFPEYKGTDPGQVLADIGRPADFSTKDSSYFDVSGKVDAIYMTYSELQFLLAEAAERAILSEDAQSFYEAGVQASFDQWGVPIPSDYLSGKAAYESGNMEKLFDQKWLSLYRNTTEAWFDWKRTGMPAFIQAGPGTQNDGEIPVRLLYPGIEQSVNPESYQAAVSALGADDINMRVWWDAK